MYLLGDGDPRSGWNLTPSDVAAPAESLQRAVSVPMAPSDRRADLRRRIAEIHRQRRELNDQQDALQADLAATWSTEDRQVLSPDLAILGTSQ